MTVTPVTVHERSGWGSIVAGLVMLLFFESIGVHLLVSIWSWKMALLVDAVDLYGIVWILSDSRALRRRPTLVGPTTIELRHGLRWKATIARDNVASVDPIRNEADWKRRTTLKMAMLDEPTQLIRLRQPVVAAAREDCAGRSMPSPSGPTTKRRFAGRGGTRASAPPLSNGRLLIRVGRAPPLSLH